MKQEHLNNEWSERTDSAEQVNGVNADKTVVDYQYMDDNSLDYIGKLREIVFNQSWMRGSSLFRSYSAPVLNLQKSVRKDFILLSDTDAMREMAKIAKSHKKDKNLTAYERYLIREISAWSVLRYTDECRAAVDNLYKSVVVEGLVVTEGFGYQ
ncbi:MAG: hypothetical protein KDH94_06540 [Coxiellaceae bacterium]|nr:hypothetical protein [Coxiellaceae bacterium]